MTAVGNEVLNLNCKDSQSANELQLSVAETRKIVAGGAIIPFTRMQVAGYGIYAKISDILVRMAYN